jgi:transcriptional regulator with XRE-family HTH domain
MSKNTEQLAISKNRLGQMLKAGREKKSYSQSDLANKLDVKAPTISNFEKGQRLPSLVQLVQLSALLELDVQTLMHVRTYDEVCLENTSNWPKDTLSQKGDLLNNLEKCIKNAESAAHAELKEHLKGRTFLDFPQAFPNIRIVTGDKREYPPKTAGDIGANSASPIDDRWVYRLGLPENTEKVSDKEFVISDKERLEKEYGNKNLLVIGSPASNHLARIINPHAIFRFNLQEGFRETFKEVLQDFLVSVPEKRDEHLKNLRRQMTQFYAFGIIDPIYPKNIRGFALRADIDFGTITFAANPYYKGDDFQYVAIIVAGFHHPATVWALRQLSEKEEFLKRPYGGVVKIKLNIERPWEERMCQAECLWDTDEYTQETLIDGLERLKVCGTSFLHVDPGEIEQSKKLLRAL